MLKPLRCMASGHKINRRRVWEDGLSYRTRCERCSIPLIKGRDGWRKFDLEADANEARLPHPTTGELT